MAAKKQICILGDSPLVEEFATLCISKGYKVQARVNSPGGKGALPKGVKKVSRPMKGVDVALELTNIDRGVKKKNLAELGKVLSAKTPILSSSVSVTADEQSGWISHPERLIGVGAFPTLIEGNLLEFAPSQFTNEATQAVARQFADSTGKECAFVQDSIGLVMPRILSLLINEAYFAMGEGVAAPRDVDTAMKLGTNYPHGPVEWGERIGARHVAAVVSALHESFGEDRYRVAPMLQKAAIHNVILEKS